MTNGGVREGTLRELILDGVEYEPAMDSEPTIILAGRSGETKIAGNGVVYGSSKPGLGGLKTDISCDITKYQKLKALQNSGRFVTVSFTDAGNNVYSGQVNISNADPLEMANGVVSLELGGNIEPN